ncbi:MAG: nucleoside hydrolase [Pirellulaceae bacterium]
MARKVIIDCDPGIDDAVALCLALFDPSLEVVGVTAVAGSVPVEQSSRNLQALIERLDPPKYPRIGVGSPPEDGPVIDGRELHGEDGLANVGYAVSRLQRQHPAEKLIADEVRAAPESVTILCLGPLTNVARAFQREPELPSLIDRLIIAGGCVDGIGNVTPAAEFNMYYDAASARAVFRSLTTKTLIPLDVSRRIAFDFDFVDQLPTAHSRAGKLLRDIVPYSFRAYHQTQGQESVLFPDAVAVMACLQPEMFEMLEMAGDVETRGELTLGATVFDRRPISEWRSNMEVAIDVDVVAVKESLVRGLMYAGQQSI